MAYYKTQEENCNSYKQADTIANMRQYDQFFIWQLFLEDIACSLRNGLSIFVK